jgi:DNA-binding response OmpR family regulator
VPSALPISILLVEDEANLRTAISAALQKYGFVVLTASDGLAAMEKFRSAPDDFDVVLLDMTLPGMSGLEVLHEMRRIRADVRIVLTSAHQVDISRLPVEGTLPVSFIHKPYRLHDLVEHLSRELSTGSESVKC